MHGVRGGGEGAGRRAIMCRTSRRMAWEQEVSGSCLYSDHPEIARGPTIAVEECRSPVANHRSH